MLVRDPAQRTSAVELLHHPFLRQAGPPSSLVPLMRHSPTWYLSNLIRFRHPDQARLRAERQLVSGPVRSTRWEGSTRVKNENKMAERLNDSLYQNIEQISRNVPKDPRQYTFVNRLKPLTRPDFNSNIYRPNENLSSIELGLSPHLINKSQTVSVNPQFQDKKPQSINSINPANCEKKVWFGYSSTQEPRILYTSVLNHESRMLDGKKLKPQQVLVENNNIPPLITFNHLGVI